MSIKIAILLLFVPSAAVAYETLYLNPSIRDCSESNPCSRCEGDCDNDDQCAGDLVCFQKDYGPPDRDDFIPGCIGIDAGSRTDWCVTDPSATERSSQTLTVPTVRESDFPSVTPTVDAIPTDASFRVPINDTNIRDCSLTNKCGRCEGDCDHDDHCEGDLICFQKGAGPEGDDEYIPSCRGVDLTDTDWCIEPSWYDEPTGPMIELVPGTESYGLLPADAPRLGLCQGNCHMDSDCKPGLFCNQREPGEEVPGCRGGRNARNVYDFCTSVPPTLPPTPMPAPFPAPTRETFRLKLYWEPGYFWQEELFEREWCMACQKSGCSAGTELHISRCGGESAYFNFVNTIDEPEEAQIRVEGTGLCLEREEDIGESYQPIVLQGCDVDQPRQRWTGTTSDGPRMELSQRSQSDYCISQQHFPKHGEVVRMEKINTARYDTSSYWVRY